MTKTVIYDMETRDSVTRTGQDILKSVTDGIFYGEMIPFFVGRRTGKSMYYQYSQNLCKEIMLPTKAKSKYKFSRAKWHTAQLNGDILWRLGHEYNQVINWCNEQFGEHPKEHDAWSRWWVGVGTIYFRDEKDYVFYKLRWI